MRTCSCTVKNNIWGRVGGGVSKSSYCSFGCCTMSFPITATETLPGRCIVQQLNKGCRIKKTPNISWRLPLILHTHVWILPSMEDKQMCKLQIHRKIICCASSEIKKDLPVHLWKSLSLTSIIICILSSSSLAASRASSWYNLKLHWNLL